MILQVTFKNTLLMRFNLITRRNVFCFATKFCDKIHSKYNYIYYTINFVYNKVNIEQRVLTVSCNWLKLLQKLE